MRSRSIWLGLAAAAGAAFAVAAVITKQSPDALARSLWSGAEGWVRSLGGGPQTAKGVGGGPAAPQGPPAVVSVSRPVVRETIEWDEYTGRFDAVASVDVKARVSGYLTEVHFKDGQPVKEGDLLYVIDPRPFERALEQARAELGQSRTRVENASLDVERGRPLMERKVMSEKVFDDRENVLREAQASAKIAEARVKSAELELSFTRMTAPIAGRIGRSLITQGNLVTGGGSATATSLATIVSQNPIHIYFDVSENNYIKYKRLAEKGTKAGASELGSTVFVALPDEKGYPHAAKLDFLDNRLDVGTGTMRARAVVGNDKGLFSPNMFARVRVAGSAPGPAVLLPDEAIGTDQTSKYVFVVDEAGLPGRRTVTLGPISEGLRIVRSGITADEWVVVKGQQRVRPGQKVDAKREQITVSQSDAPREPASPNR